MQELATAIGISPETITAFNPDHLSVREKLWLASTCKATMEDDIAYSLIGIFKGDTQPGYGEGYAALGHLLEETVARSGEVTVLDWHGQSSPYNSCLPATLAVYSRPPGALLAVDDAETDERVAEFKKSLSQQDAILIHDQITRLPPARFGNHRLHPSGIIFAVTRLGMQDFGSDRENRCRAKVAGLGTVDFTTSDRLSLAEPRQYIAIHPWIRSLCDPFDGFTHGSTADDDSDDDDGKFELGPDDEAGSGPSSPIHVVPMATMDEYTRALRPVVRLQQPFPALLHWQQPNGETQARCY